jgi:hypothetical protein
VRCDEAHGGVWQSPEKERAYLDAKVTTANLPLITFGLSEVHTMLVSFAVSMLKSLNKKTRFTVVGLGLLILPLTSFGQAEGTYKLYCSKCHGLDGSGSTAAGKKLGAADLRSQKIQDTPDDELFATIAYGVRHKQYPHAFARRGLTQKQVADLVAYIRKLSRPR